MTCPVCGEGRERCHRCGGELRECLDGEMWCRRCQRYQRSVHHGWAWYSSEEYYEQLRGRHVQVAS